MRSSGNNRLVQPFALPTAKRDQPEPGPTTLANFANGHTFPEVSPMATMNVSLPDGMKEWVENDPDLIDTATPVIACATCSDRRRNAHCESLIRRIGSLRAPRVARASGRWTNYSMPLVSSCPTADTWLAGSARRQKTPLSRSSSGAWPNSTCHRRSDITQISSILSGFSTRKPPGARLREKINPGESMWYSSCSASEGRRLTDLGYTWATFESGAQNRVFLRGGNLS